MNYIITLNSKSAAAKNLLNYLKTLDFITVKEEKSKKTALAKAEKPVLNTQQKKFKKMLFEGLDELDNFRKKEGKLLKK